MDAKQYRKTALITASQWFEFGDHPAVSRRRDPDGYEDFIIETLEGELTVTPGDWIATGVQGEHWAIKPDIFAATYEAVSTRASPTTPVELKDGLRIWREADRVGEKAYAEAAESGATADNAHAAGELAAAAIITDALAEKEARTFASLNDDLEFILGQPCFTFIRHAQIWRAAGHQIQRRAEAEQAFFIGRMLHHYFSDPSRWHDLWADEIEAVQNQARAALENTNDK